MTNEVLIIGCLGLGHYNPSVQLARACVDQMRSMNKEGKVEGKVTLISPLSQEMALRVLSAEENENVKANDWIERSLEDGGLDQFVIVMEALAPGVPTMQALAKDQAGWASHIRTIYERRATKPDLILADMVIHIDIPLAREWNIKSYSFWPSPLTCYYMIPKIAARMGLGAKDEASEPSTESTVESELSSECSLESKLIFDGLPGLECDFDGETLQLDVVASADFIRMHMSNNSARHGVICNDVAGFYTPEFLESCKMTEQFSVLPVGPLATNYEYRLTKSLSTPDDVIDWLDTKANKSCIFMSVGSYFDLPPAIISTFTKAFTQLIETNEDISILWAHRPISKFTEITEYEADASGLPKGWAESHNGRLKVKSWLNQPRVLQHRAIGLFMTHSGWNGLLEAISLGHAPLLFLPVNSEQPANAKIMESYNEVGERLWRNIGEISEVDVDRIINKINSCRNNPKYTKNLAKLQSTALKAWESQTGSSRMNFQKLLQPRGGEKGSI